MPRHWTPSIYNQTRGSFCTESRALFHGLRLVLETHTLQLTSLLSSAVLNSEILTMAMFHVWIVHRLLSPTAPASCSRAQECFARSRVSGPPWGWSSLLK